MADEMKLEQRVEALERAVAELQRQLAGIQTPGNWLDQITGSITDKAAFEEALAYGRAYRNADRPPDEPEDQA